MMQLRQENVLEFIINTLKERSGSMDIYSLEKAIIRSNDSYFETRFLADRLQQLELVEYNVGQDLKLTQKGWDFTSFSDIKMKDYEQNEAHSLTIQNLKLQNEMLNYQYSEKDKQSEIDNLTIENLRLQNRQLKWYIIFSILSFISGAILTNIKDIWVYLKGL
jgi:hypothetical protein